MIYNGTRTYHAIKNTIFGLIASVVTVILNMVLRVIIVDYLGDQINGLNSLFISTISVLALVQMGFSTAMVINLYKPVQEENKELISQLINYYKVIYRRVALLFLLLGLLVCLFLMNELVTTTINMTLVRIYFMLFVMSYFVNYCTYYKRSLLFAEQKNRVSVICTMVCEVIFRGLAIALIICFKSYTIFLILLICEYACSNLWCARYVDKHHPYLKNYKHLTLSVSDRKSIGRTIRPLMVNQISDTVQKSSQSILISILLGNVAIVGYYGSYQLISSTIQLLMSQVGGAFTSGFGNLSALEDEGRLAYVFKKFFFVVSFISILLCTITFCGIQDIILFLFGPNFILPMSAVALIMIILFFTIVSIPIISVQNALGLHKLDSKWMVVQAFFAIIFGYLGGRLFGMNGILLGSLFPTIIFTVIGKGIIISNHVFKKHKIHYLMNICQLLFRLLVVVFPSVLITSLVSSNYLISDIILKSVLSFMCSVLMLGIVYMKNQYFFEYLQTIIYRIKKK